MKIIRWISSIALLGAVAIVALLATAAVGDAVFIRRDASVAITNPQKTLLATAVTALFPSANPATISKVYCYRDFENIDATKVNDVYCSGLYVDTLTEAEYLAAELAGTGGPVDNVAPGAIDFKRALPTTQATGANLTKVKNFVEDVWPTVLVTTVATMSCERDLAAPAQINCECAYFDTASPADYATLKQAGQVVQLTGIVE